MLTGNLNIEITTAGWTLRNNRRVQFDVARLDALHPVISGNKWFKLKYNLQQAALQQKAGILTMGGAFSNHLAATAFACRQVGLQSAAIVRGEIIHPLNPTLTFCNEMGMQLLPVPRSAFEATSSTVAAIRQQYATYLFVSEGGSNEAGVTGSSEIADCIAGWQNYKHIVCAIGTGTTCKGLLQRLEPHQQLWGIPVLRIPPNRQTAFLQSFGNAAAIQRFKPAFEFAGRGYGKADAALFEFMNAFYKTTGIPSDFVYTGKVFRAVVELFETGRLKENERVLVLHTGGLQGNASLPAQTLCFG
ncbi:MAG: 1-aminocyclopropane-1-carboxylate deaminase/D-cysteine desulfhydrase [Lacibacter sp.]|jgi:1-aminocyclopropane-1-carboxylate deaminase/D-cysteine desulfhydrase-like pyridoxal-dependent ACC family enzyme